MGQKTFYGWSKEGKVLIVGDHDNFPVKRGSPWILVATVFSIAAVVIAAFLTFTPALPAGK
jgi:hypothetical protein